MSATTARSAGPIRRPLCSTPRATERANIPNGICAGWAGILQADAFAGYNRLYLADRKPGPIVEALCWSHARRKFFELADIAANLRRGKQAAPISPIALEAVKRIDAIFDVEREINGRNAEERLRDALGAFTRFLDDGRICLTNNAAERALRGLALGRKSWLFAGSDASPSAPLSCTRSSRPRRS